jgi:hypothetical protein
MPELSGFFGIVVRTFAEPVAPHHRPHFRAYCRGKAVVLALDLVEVLEGALDRREQRLVEAWAEPHLGELRADWELLQAGRPPRAIAPLR